MDTLAYRLLTILAIALLMSTTGCGGNAATQAPATAPAMPTATTIPTPAPTIQPGDSERNVTVKGSERTYQVHIPAGIDSLQPVPVVLAFHGSGQEPANMEILTEFTAVADQGKFVLIYPVGLGLTWNAGGTCCGYALTENIDDIAFVRQILSDLEMVVSVDAKRIYATGFSNGAAFVHRLACEMSDVFAAVASVSGILAYSPCQAQQPVSVMHVHGLDDVILPYEGGGEFEMPPVEEIMSMWVEINGCRDSPSVENPIKTIKHTAYTSCEGGAAVELYAVEAGGHSWVSKYIYPISEVIWEFFVAHPKP